MSLETAIQLHAAGQLDAAEREYRGYLAQCPGNDVALGNLAIVYLIGGRTDEALELLQSAIDINFSNPEYHLNYGIGLKNKGDHSGSIERCYRALELNPVYPEAYNNLGVAHLELGKRDEAADFFQMAVELRANFPEAHYNLGNLYCALGRHAEGVASYQKAIEYRPNYPDAYLTLAAALSSQGQLDQAAACLSRALELRPDYPEACLNLGSLFNAQGKFVDAVAMLRRAIELRPSYAEAYNNLGIALRDSGRLNDAAEAYCKAIELSPGMSSAHSNLGSVLLVQNRTNDAIAAQNKALEIQTRTLGLDSQALKVCQLLNELERFPIVYRDSAELELCRANYTNCLNEALHLVSQRGQGFSELESKIILRTLFRITNFYLGYQQLDDKELQIKYCRLVAALLPPAFGQFLRRSASGPTAGRKIRFGVASELLNRHSATYWSLGWLTNLPRDDYEIFVYCLNGKTDDVTQQLAALGTYRWLPFREGSLQKSLEIIRDDQLDVLLVPDVGMTASGRLISLFRLAPIQFMAFTHPITSGSPNIDYYLSSELMEGPEADAHYSEQLVRLTNLGACLENPLVLESELSRSDFGLPDDRILFGSVQSLFKYLPQFDYIYPAIARQLPDAMFVFIGNDSDLVTGVFAERLKHSFESSGLDFERHVKILPRMPLNRFIQLVRILDANIDSIGWNGSTTTLSSLANDCPVITMPAQFMRGRHCNAILKVIGADELIADTVEEYIALACRIAVDKPFRSRMVDLIRENRHKLFNDRQCVAQLDQFLKDKVAEQRSQTVAAEDSCSNQLSGQLSGAEHQAGISATDFSDLYYADLAFECLIAGRYQESVEHLSCALKINDKNPDVHLKMGCALKAMGDFAGAIASWQSALDIKPDYPEACLNLGVAWVEQGRLEEASNCYQRAIAIRPDYAEAHYNLGNVWNALNKPDDAIGCYRSALELKPDFLDAHLNLGNSILHSNIDEAIECYRKALEINPNYAQAHINLGGALRALGALDEAISCYHAALAIRPDYAEAHNNLAVALRELGRFSESAASCRQALEINPGYTEAIMNLGLVLKDMGEFDQSIASYKTVLQLSPNNVEAYRNLADCFYALGDLDKALSFDHESAKARVASLPPYSEARRLSELLVELKRIPTLYRDASEIDKCRKNFSNCLAEALQIVTKRKHGFTEQETKALREIVFGITNFYLGYQQKNDKELQVAYATVATKILAADIGPYLALERGRQFGPKIRLGLASEYLRHHNGSYWAYGWLANLPKEDYEFFLYSLNGQVDHVTEKFATLGTYRWLPFRSLNYQRSLETIRQDNLDVLLLTDVGMTVSSNVLSLTRMAPVQCVAFGHPITTGSANMDYYLSSELMETEDSEDQYCEQLIRLPNTGFTFEYPPVPAELLTRAHFELPDNRIIYGSVQSLFKYLPQYDFLYPAIAKKVPDAFFVFVANESAQYTAVFRERLRNSFAQAGLDSEHYVKILPRMPLPRFLQLLAVLDLNLDTVGWNGGTTSLRSLAMDCPVVTVPGRTMRSRHCYSILKTLGVDELIVGSLEEYVELAAKIGIDRQYRAALVEKIKDGKHALFYDSKCVEFLDGFFKSQVARIRGEQ